MLLGVNEFRGILPLFLTIGVLVVFCHHFSGRELLVFAFHTFWIVANKERENVLWEIRRKW